MPAFFLGQALASVAVLVVAACACRVLRASSAAHRHFVWFLAFAAMVVMPAVSWFMAPLFSRPKPISAAPVVSMRPTSVHPAGPSASGPAPSRRINWTALAGTVWGLGALILTARTLSGVWTCERRRRRGLRSSEATQTAAAIGARMHLTRPVPVLVSGEVAVPETFGLVSPVIVLPEASRHWPTDRLRFVLLHELFHIKRHDWAVHLTARISAALFWFNPLSRYGLARLCDERERACDDDVLRFGVAGPDYARELVAIAEACRAAPASSIAMGRAAQFEGRVRAILNPQANHRGMTMTSRILTLASAAVVILTASLVAAPAQTGAAKVGGIVLDASGARVPGAQVVISKGSALETIRAARMAASSSPESQTAHIRSAWRRPASSGSKFRMYSLARPLRLS